MGSCKVQPAHLSLGVVEVGWNSDDCILHWLTEVPLCSMQYSVRVGVFNRA